MSKRYELFGWDYEAITPENPAEIAWHQRWARRTGGPVLVLACGTGRLVCRLAESGFPAVGIDISGTMLRLARWNAGTLPQSIRRRVRFISADMTDFHLRDRFGLIAISDNSFREVGTRAKMRRCLRCIRTHLIPKGVLVVTERRFKAGEFPRSGVWSRNLINPRTKERVARRLELRLTPSGRRIVGRFQYRVMHADASETITNCPINLPAVTTSEFLSLFRSAGFNVKVRPGYGEGEDDGKSALVSFVCTPSTNRPKRQRV